jgi:hypothetical protein
MISTALARCLLVDARRPVGVIDLLIRESPFMALPKDNRVIIVVGAGLVIIAAVVLALIFTGGANKPSGPKESYDLNDDIPF